MFGDRIAYLRKLNNYTQKELADKLNLTPKAISFYELNEREPSLETLIQLSHVFDTSLDYLILGSNHKNVYIDTVSEKDKEYFLDEALYINEKLKKVSPSQRKIFIKIIDLFLLSLKNQ